MSEHFSKILKEYRLRKDLSLRDLANQVNVSFSYISKLEKGLYNPSKKVVIDLAKALGAPKDKFLAAAGYLPENNFQPYFPQTEEEAKVLSLLRRTHPHIVNLIEQAAELPEDQQELVAGHWKWALDVVRRQEEYKTKNEQSLHVEEKQSKYQEKEPDDIDVRNTPMAANLEDGTESILLTPELKDLIENSIRESRRKRREREEREKQNQKINEEATTDKE